MSLQHQCHEPGARYRVVCHGWGVRKTQCFVKSLCSLEFRQHIEAHSLVSEAACLIGLNQQPPTVVSTNGGPEVNAFEFARALIDRPQSSAAHHGTLVASQHHATLWRRIGPRQLSELGFLVLKAQVSFWALYVFPKNGLYGSEISGKVRKLNCQFSLLQAHGGQFPCPF